MLATNSCAMTRNAGSPYDLPRTFVFGQCVIERYFFIHKARFLAASPRRPDVLGKLDQFFDDLATPVHSPHLSFTSIFPKFSPLNNLRKAVGAFSMPCSMVSFHVILPSCIQPDISLWNSGM